MDVVVRDEVDLPAGVEEVWEDLVQELSGAGTWWSERNTFRCEGDRVDQVGVLTRMSVHPRGVGRPGPRLKFTGRTRTAVPGRELTMDYVDGCFAGSATFSLRPLTAGPGTRPGSGPGPWTRLGMEFRATPRGWVRLLGAVADIGAEHSRGTRQAFARWRVALTRREGRPASAPAGPVAPAAELLLGQAAQRTNSRVRTSDGASLAVVRRRPAAGASAAMPRVLLLHGWGGRQGHWDGVASILLAAGLEVVTMDLRGHGASVEGTAPLSWQRLTQDITEVLVATAEAGVGVVLVGHSASGISALLAATESAESPVRGLVLVATALTRGTSSPGEVRLMGSRGLSAVLRRPTAAAALLSRTMGPATPGSAVRRVARDLAATPGNVRARFFRLTLAVTPGLTARLGALRVPVGVVGGTEDRVVGPELLDRTAALAGVEPVLINGVGHAVSLEAPDAVAEVVLQTVRRVVDAP